MNSVLNIVTGGTEPLTMTSLEVAELVEKRHDNVKRTIDTLSNQEVISLPQIEEVKVERERRAEVVQVYRVGKRDSFVIVAQLSPEFTARLVDRWQELEARQTAAPALAFSVPQTMPEALRLAADLAEQRDQLAIENKAQADALAVAEPKAHALDLIAADDKALTMTQAAKLLGIKRDTLTNWLSTNGWVYRQNGSWVAYQQHIHNGRLLYKEAKYTDETTSQEVYRPYCHITPKGLAYLAQQFTLRLAA